MLKNNNPEIVVMDRRISDTLLHYARIGASEVGTDIESEERHIRKFNTAVSDDHQTAINRRRETFNEGKMAVRKLLSTHSGNPIYMKVAREVLGVVRLVGIVRGSKVHVRVHDLLTEQFDEVHIDEVFAELPEGYRKHEIGKWKGRYVANTKVVDPY